MIKCKTLQGEQGILHFHDSWMVGKGIPVGDYEAGDAFLSHFEGEVVAVEMLAFEGEEHGVFFNLPAVGADFVGFAVILVDRHGYFLV